MVDVQIFPHRLLNSATVEKLLNRILKFKGTGRILLIGEKLCKDDPERRRIKVGDDELDLQVLVGRIIIEAADEDTTYRIKDVCDEILPTFEFWIGEFIRSKKTVTDSLKYGDKVNGVPVEFVGLTDPNAKLRDRIKILKKEERID